MLSLSGYMNGMKGAKKLGMDEVEKPETIVIDYGGANVAKPLHVGHLRSAVIGEALKRMGRFVGLRSSEMFISVTGDSRWALSLRN